MEGQRAEVLYAEILEAVSRYAAELLSVDVGALTPETVLLDLGAQSFDFMHLVSRLEQEFDIRMPRTYAVPDTHTIAVLAKAVQDVLNQEGRRS